MKALLIANRTGGVGKTTVTDFLKSYLDGKNITFGLISLDSGSNGEPSKLSKRYDGVENLSPVFNEDAVGTSGDWQPVLEGLTSGDTLIDFGANTTQHFLNWAEKYQIGSFLDEGSGFSEHAPVIFIPVTGDVQPVADAIELITEFEKIKDSFPVEKFVIVLNNFHSKVDMVVPDNLKEFLSTREKSVSVVTMSRCNDIQAMALLASSNKPLREIVDSTVADSYFIFSPDGVKNTKSAMLVNTLRIMSKKFEAELDRIGLIGLLSKYSSPSADVIPIKKDSVKKDIASEK